MSTTRRHICELIQRQLSGGFPSADTEVTINLINQYLNAAVAFSAKTAYKESIQIDGIENVPDAFYATFSGLPISLDDITGLYQVILPQQPAGVGLGWDIAHFMIISGSGKKIFANPISPKELPYLYNDDNDCGDIYYYVDNITANLHSCKNITPYKASVRILSTQSSALDSPMNIPDTALPVIIEYIDKTLGVQLQMPVDVSEDGAPTPQIK